MLRSSLYDYSDAYILMSGTITVTALAVGGANNNIPVVLKNCAPFTDRISFVLNTKLIQNFMSQLQLNQLMIMQNYCSNQNKDSNA